MWSAWGVVVLYAAYAAAVAASGVITSGAPKDPAWAVAEVLTVVGVPIQIVLVAAIYESAAEHTRIYGLLAFGLTLIWGALTSAVHFTELIVARRPDVAADPTLARVFDFTHPSLLLGVELLAWHFFFGLSMVFAAFVFAGPGTARWVRAGLLTAGMLSLVGLIGPIIDNSYVRSIGAVGYGVVFPIVCVVMGFVFRSANRHTQALNQRDSA